MKQIFCDCCGAEFRHEPARLINGSVFDCCLPTNGDKPLQGKVSIEFMFKDFNVDICQDCRWKAVLSLRNTQ